MRDSKVPGGGIAKSRCLMFRFKIAKGLDVGNDREDKSRIVDDTDRFTCQKY